MSTTGHHFRTVAFGGFHKQDVLNYITSANKENQDQSSDLKKQAEEAMTAKAKLEEKLEVTESASQKNAAECVRLTTLLTERTNALEQAQRELTALKAEHEAAAARLAELEDRFPKLEADSAAYSDLKDHTATIEMEARRKGCEIVEQAQAQADKMRAEIEGWLRRVQNNYQMLRTDVAATVNHLMNELERSSKTLEETAPAFCRHDETLSELLDCEKNSGPKAPEPLPLEETEVNNG